VEKEVPPKGRARKSATNTGGSIKTVTVRVPAKRAPRRSAAAAPPHPTTPPAGYVSSVEVANAAGDVVRKPRKMSEKELAARKAAVAAENEKSAKLALERPKKAATAAVVQPAKKRKPVPPLAAHTPVTPRAAAPPAEDETVATVTEAEAPLENN
jgi:hypothetical protein